MTIVTRIHFVREVSFYFATPAINKRLVEWQLCDINQQSVLIVEENVKAVREIESLKTKTDWCWKFGLVNSAIQTICKNRTKIISASEQNG